MALLTTFATTPIVSVLYPPWYQVKIAAWRRGEIDWDTGAPISPSDTDESTKRQASMKRVGRMLVYLRLDSMPTILNLLSTWTTAIVIGTRTETTTMEKPDANAVAISTGCLRFPDINPFILVTATTTLEH